jgi:hypothetical protein
MSYLFSEANKRLLKSDNTIDKSLLNDEQREVYENSQLEADPTLVRLGTSLVATYKIQIMFDYQRTGKNVVPCLISFWRSSGKLSEDNDSLLYVCKYEKDPRLGCGMPFLSESRGALVNGTPMQLFECTHCKRYVNRATVCNDVVYKLPAEKLAPIVYKYFRALNSDADIYLKHFKSNTIKEDYTELKNEYSIYPLARLIKDASLGSSQTIKNIEAFLRA